MQNVMLAVIYAGCHLCKVALMLSVASKLNMLSVVLLNAIMLKVVILNVVAPLKDLQYL